MKTFVQFAENYPGQSIPQMDLRTYQTQLGQAMQRLLVDVASMQPEDGQTETEQIMIKRFHEIIDVLRRMDVPLGHVGG